MKRWLIGLTLAALACAAQALPTAAEVQAEVDKGNYAQAQTMMHDVVVAKPGSARAHYIYAEILAHNDQFALAAQEAALARQLDPAFKFTSPEKFRAFEQLLEREQQRASTRARNGSSLDALAPATPARPVAREPSLQGNEPVRTGLPSWIWWAGLAALAMVAWNWLRRSRSTGATAPSGAAYGGAAGYAPGGLGGPSGPPAGGGSGLMGVGLAAAGGLAAGMLAEKLLDRGHEPRRLDSDADREGAARTPAYADEDARALENRGVDFGSGDNNWDAGASDAGSMDVGGGSDDGGW